MTKQTEQGAAPVVRLIDGQLWLMGQDPDGTWHQFGFAGPIPLPGGWAAALRIAGRTISTPEGCALIPDGYAHSRECIVSAGRGQGWVPTAEELAQAGPSAPGLVPPDAWPNTMALIAAAFEQTGHAQGTPINKAFVAGSRWTRRQVLEAEATQPAAAEQADLDRDFAQLREAAECVTAWNGYTFVHNDPALATDMQHLADVLHTIDCRREATPPSQAPAGASFPDECVASGQSCSYGPHGPKGEQQCQYCGEAPAGVEAVTGCIAPAVKSLRRSASVIFHMVAVVEKAAASQPELQSETPGYTGSMRVEAEHLMQAARLLEAIPQSTAPARAAEATQPAAADWASYPSQETPEPRAAGRWVVDVKGASGTKGFEISVLRDDNEHGKRSYGWFDADKLLITHNGGPCEWPLTQRVWDKAVRLAHEVAAELNATEGRAP